MKQGIRRDLKDFRVGGIPDYSRLFPTILWSGFGQISTLLTTTLIDHITPRSRKRKSHGSRRTDLQSVACFLDRPKPCSYWTIYGFDVSFYSPANRHHGVWFSWFHKCTVVKIDEIAFAMSPIIVVTWIEPYRSLASTH